jgi:hypothetical protein
MALVTGTLESSGITIEFKSDANLPRDIPSVLAGLSNVHSQFNQYLTSSLHLNMEPENDEVLPGESESEDDGEKEIVPESQRNRKKAKK